MNDIIEQLKDWQSYYGVVSVEKHERYSGTEDRYTIYLYNKDIPIVGGQYIDLSYSTTSQNGRISIKEITVVDSKTKDYDYEIVTSESFSNKNIFKVEKIFKQMVAIGMSNGIKRRILIFCNWFRMDSKFRNFWIAMVVLFIIQVIVYKYL